MCDLLLPGVPTSSGLLRNQKNRQIDVRSAPEYKQSFTDVSYFPHKILPSVPTGSGKKYQIHTKLELGLFY